MSNPPTQPMRHLPPPVPPRTPPPPRRPLPPRPPRSYRGLIAGLVAFLVLAAIGAGVIVFVVNSNNATARQHARLAHQTQVANANAQAAQAKANTAQANAAAAQAKAQSDQANAAAAKANSQTAQANAAAAQANAAASANPNQSSTPATQPTNNGDPTAGLTWQEPNIWSTSGISNQLANNVFYRYWNGNSSSFSAWSEASKAWYPINCTSDSSYVYCNVGGTGDPDAEVLIAQQGLSAYTQAQADAYVASPNYQGP